MILRHITWRGLVFLAVFLLMLATLRDRFDQWVRDTELPPIVQETSVEVRDRSGALLRAYTTSGGYWRLATTLDHVDPRYVDMLIAFEDKRFFTHNGVDLRAMSRAASQAIWNGHIISGASTLTMQVARLLEGGSTGSWQGKIRQIRLALALERTLTKDEILTLYLNRAPFGGNIEGVRAASRAYFAKSARRLTAAEAALLVALPQSPEGRRPDLNSENAHLARDRILDRLALANVLPPDEIVAAKTEPIPRNRREFPRLAPHLSDRAIGQAPLRSEHYLTVDARLQESLEALAITALRNQNESMQVAILLADHTTGEILASVGSAGYKNTRRRGFVDMTNAVRSPGSTLKPLIYGLAFDQGLAHPETLIQDRPTAFGSYVPQNFDGQFRGLLPVRKALQLSLNIPVVSLTQALGPARLVAALKQAGVTPIIPGGKAGLAVALGGVGVTLTDLVTLYGGLAEGGQTRPLYWRQEDEPIRTGRRFLAPIPAWYVNDILAGVAPPKNAPKGRIAYKTGTSYGHRDAWAIGFDGKYVAGVWMGRADGTSLPGIFGGELAAPILFEAFARLNQPTYPLAPPPAAALTVANADLPQPLKEFRPRDAAFSAPMGGPELAFPPDGAILEKMDVFVAKVRDGEAPFTWLLNGALVQSGTRTREVALPYPGRGFVSLSVIDAQGRSARTDVFVN
ncbi:penicillin-binding protein 1C [Falsihalocynthiibacter sp. S25ZX9]|uniref:penicillin-binding protein 1C n=1 Tax=Falsihalocynthiibacter sp. S25ZX9 TaxID=3240870 RepID=UPI00350EEC4D